MSEIISSILAIDTEIKVIPVVVALLVVVIRLIYKRYKTKKK